jgi:fatty acid desaturase
MRMVLAPYWVNYHLEHHLFVYTPCWKLPAAHKILVEQGFGPRMELAQGYLQVLRKATAKDPSSPDASGRVGRRAKASMI